VIRVLLVDDQALVRHGFEMILRSEPDTEVVGQAGDGGEAVALAERLRPDVVLMDVRMPGMDGIEATRRIVADGSSPRVLVLTTFDNDEIVLGALRCGASGFLLKDAPGDQLVSAIRVVAGGSSLFSPTVTRRLVQRYVGRGPTQHPAGLDRLTDRELEVLRLVAAGGSNAEIAASLVVSEHTVKTHVAHILDKLGLRDRTQAVVLAYEAGVVRPGE
jgi:DNA-binding NarL/FixJ family response regulator